MFAFRVIPYRILPRRVSAARGGSGEATPPSGPWTGVTLAPRAFAPRVFAPRAFGASAVASEGATTIKALGVLAGEAGGSALAITRPVALAIVSGDSAVAAPGIMRPVLAALLNGDGGAFAFPGVRYLTAASPVGDAGILSAELTITETTPVSAMISGNSDLMGNASFRFSVSGVLEGDSSLDLAPPLWFVFPVATIGGNSNVLLLPTLTVDFVEGTFLTVTNPSSTLTDRRQYARRIRTI